MADDKSAGSWAKSPPPIIGMHCSSLSARVKVCRQLPCSQSVGLFPWPAEILGWARLQRGRQTKRRHCLTPKLLSDTFVFSSQQGYVRLWGEERQKERILETEPRANKATVVSSYVYIFSSLNVIFTPCVLVVGPPLPPPSFVLLRLWASCPVLLYQHILSEPKRKHIIFILQPELLSLDITYSCWSRGSVTKTTKMLK